MKDLRELTKVKLTNLDKIFYPEVNVSKGQVIEYYIKMAPKILPIIADRPLVLTRYPDGIEGDKFSFFEKDAPQGTPEWVKIKTIYSPTSQRDVHYIICNDLDTLIWLANLAALEIHMPFSKINALNTPDLLFFDVDPEPPATLSDAAEVALLLKDKLIDLGLTPFIKTSGKKGLHVIVPIVPEHTFEKQGLLCIKSESSWPRKVTLLFQSSRIQRSRGRFSLITFRIRRCGQWWFRTV